MAFAEECPTGVFDVCRDARVPNAPYRQGIFYYGIATDTRYLESSCASQSQGRWEEPSAAKKP